MRIDFSQAQWLNPPGKCSISAEAIEITTDPGSDLWQRTYYGFRNDNAPMLLAEIRGNFTFTVKAEFEYKALFDQCGVVVYLDSSSWFKASVEYENEGYSRLGSVVTNSGYSDWATTDIGTPSLMWYRLSRRGPDFLIEYAFDGKRFMQMRIFHLHVLGETTPKVGNNRVPVPAEMPIRFGLYACSPGTSSFTARFSELRLQECLWEAHQEG